MERRLEAAEVPASAKGLRNQFNFSERGAQTMLFMPKHRALQVDTPPVADASGECSAWGVYDTYMQDQAQQHHQVRSFLRNLYLAVPVRNVNS